ncbi:MAG: hydroxyethylthiazole kinase [Bacteroidales bacterium]
MITQETIINDLAVIRSKSPLVHNITNYVVMNFTANTLLAVGASPVMAHAVEEVEEMVKIASSLVINIGTLSKNWIDAMIRAGIAAKGKGIPVVLDPVGAGATAYRTKTSLEIINKCSPSIIRGNASEIISLTDAESKTKGVDSIISSDAALNAAKILANDTNAVIVISGSVDYIVDYKSVIEVRNGSPLMSRVTGMGCAATAVVGAFAAINKNFLMASAHAMAVTGIAGELAAKKSEGPGTMQINFIDTLYKLKDEDIKELFNSA